ncbi:MAG TPA: chromate transporter [Thermodesulfovibrionales bacterium]|nr:chromate transporter [Thermodesulfovibrionales bacterium]
MEIFTFFWTIFYINLFTIGGGYVMLPLLQREVVDHYHWLSNKEFVESIAIGQVTPGPLTIMNVFIGYKIFGFWGALGAVIFSYLPSIILVTIASHYYLKFKNSWIVKASFQGIRPAVIGLLAAIAITLGRASIVDVPTGLIATGGFAILVFTKVEPTFVILGSGVAGALLY